MKKECVECHIEKNWNNFYFRRNNYLDNTCKECREKRRKELYQLHRKDKTWVEEKRKYNRERMRDYSKDKKKENDRKYYQNHSEKIKERVRNYTQENELKVRQYRKQYYSEHQKERILYSIQWAKKNPDKANTNKKRYKDRLFSTVEGRLRDRISNTVRLYLKKENQEKTNSTMDYVSFSIAELKSHLELLFDSDMTWNNYGNWHIDHIIPQILYDFSDIEEIKKCWSLKNLRPLWANENLSKSSSIDKKLIEDYDLFDILPVTFEKGVLK